MNLRSSFLFVVVVVGGMASGRLVGQTVGVSDADRLRQGFLDPPASARPRVWWHWMNGNITKEGIKLDLEWMKRVGIGGFQNFDAALNTPQVVEKRLAYMTPEWKDAFRYTAGLADQMGLEMAIASSPGWSETGGPWVKPSQAMKKLVWSQTLVEGGQPFSGVLAKPSSVTGPFGAVPYVDALATATTAPSPEFYAEALVLAYPVPAGAATELKPDKVSSSQGAVEAGPLMDGDLMKGDRIPMAAGKPSWILYEYDAPKTVQSAMLATPAGSLFSGGPGAKYQLEASEDGLTFRSVASLPAGGVPQHTVSFAPTTARYFRVSFEPVSTTPPGWMMDSFTTGADLNFSGLPIAPPIKDAVTVNELVLYSGPRVNRFEEKAGFGLVRDYYEIGSDSTDTAGAVSKEQVVDLTKKLRPDGSLDWTPPSGKWMVLRMGYSLLGTLNHPATAEATGLEVDKLNKGYVRGYIDTYLDNYRNTLGPSLMGKHGVRAFLTDSIEVGAQNWTDNILDEFRHRRGYDPRPYVPALTGVLIGNPAQSDRFLWDFRRTLAELIAQNHYGEIAARAHANGLTYYNESLEGTRVSIGDDMEMRQNSDIPMAAMWTYPAAVGPQSNYVADIRGAASVAHIYGQNLTAAESLTSGFAPWRFSPRNLKPIIDLEFALGLNRPVIHTSVHQPLVDKKPGLSLMIFGQYFNRNETWAEQAKAWVSYISRNAYLLQQGKFVGDVAYFYGEEAPLAGLYGEGGTLPKDLPRGYGFDFVNSDVVLHRLSVRNRELITASGMQYRVIYLGGSTSRMTVAVLRKLRDLVEAGGVIVGNRPSGSPSLADDAAEFAKLTDELWGAQNALSGEHALGKGKVIAGTDVNTALASLGDQPDFEYEKPQADSDVMFLHRHLSEGDLYFLSNRQPRTEVIEAKFRVTGRRPELWHAETGQVEAVSYRVENGRTVVPISLSANDAVFVVFRKSADSQNATVPPIRDTVLATLDSPWNIEFEPNRGAPVQTTFAQLTSWSDNSDLGIKYFSGIGTYKQLLDVPARQLGSGVKLILDLGDVHELAEVLINGKSLGVTWHPPYRVDVTKAVKAGENSLEVRVTNLWVNRLIGDLQPGATKYTFTVAPTYKPDAPLVPSGLLGPVTLRQLTQGN